jgi:hypothetical protein
MRRGRFWNRLRCSASLSIARPSCATARCQNLNFPGWLKLRVWRWLGVSVGEANVSTTTPEALDLALTIQQFRLQILRIPQEDVAEKLRCPQGSVSKVEKHGHLPRPWDRQRWADAYSKDSIKLTVEQFEQLVRNQLIQIALKKKVSETEPLLATGQTEERAEVTDLTAAKARTA